MLITGGCSATRAGPSCAGPALVSSLVGSVPASPCLVLLNRVQHRGDVAVLSYNLVSYAKRPNGGSVIVRWNSTAVYERIEGKWKMIHSHWSYTKMELKSPNPE